MPEGSFELSSRRVLEPIDRVSEVLFGLILVLLCTFPVVIPFIFMHNAGPALRVSNAIAIVMLFLTGYAFGRMTGRHPWLVGISMVVLGLILVGLTMALGG